jgi:hypothetical protein
MRDEPFVRHRRGTPENRRRHVIGNRHPRITDLLLVSINSGSGQNLGEGRSLSSGLWRFEVRETRGETCLQPPVEQFYSRLRKVVDSFHRPTHLLTFREPSIYQMIHDRFGRCRRYPTAVHACLLIVDKIAAIVHKESQ